MTTGRLSAARSADVGRPAKSKACLMASGLKPWMPDGAIVATAGET